MVDNARCLKSILLCSLTLQWNGEAEEMNGKGKTNDIGNARTNVIESTRPAKGTSAIPLIQPFAVSPTKIKN